ncbi:MAG: lysophospholipid acyltransferase family protein [bacterium]
MSEIAMSDAFYTFVKRAGTPIFWLSSRPFVTGVSHIPRIGPCIIAATHQSPYDVPLLIRHSPRHLDFVSILEVFRKPLVGWLYRSLNAFPLDRSKADPAAVRIVLDRLRQGRVIAMFPEGGFRYGARSVVHGGPIRPGIARISALAKAPIIPCVVLNSMLYARYQSWLPLRQTRYAIAFGEPVPAGDSDAGCDIVEAQLVRNLRSLHSRLLAETGLTDLNAPTDPTREA